MAAAEAPAASSATIGGGGAKIYFAASIRGGRDDVPFYQSLIAHLGTHGRVLTEHIGKAAIESMGETGVTEDFIYKRDVDWLLESDFVVAEVTQPSLGVGYELGFAEAKGKPVLCIFRASSGRSLSAMIRGDAYFTTKDYNTLEDAYGIIDAFVTGLREGGKLGGGGGGSGGSGST